MLNEDVISIIKEYTGFTSLDIVNAFYELKRTMNDNDVYICQSVPNIKKIKTLLKWIPILYKSTKKYEIGKNKKHYLESCLWYSVGYVSRLDTVVAFKLLFPIEIRNGVAMFQTTEKNSKEISKYIKQTLHIDLPLYKIQPEYIKYINGIASHKLIGQCVCGVSKKLDIYNDIMLCRHCIRLN